MDIMVPVWHVHHNPEVWPDPFTFDPNRFAEKNKIPAEHFLSFGIGPRICLGMKLANLEAKIMITTVLSKFRLTLRDDIPDPLPLRCQEAFLAPATPLKITFNPL